MTITRADRVLWRRTLDGVVVLPPTGHVLHLDRTAAMIWDLVAVPVTMTDVVNTVADMCDASPDDVIDGAGSLLTTLHDAGATTESAP